MINDTIVVGIGASAGGLEAITDFFDNIPSDTGLAFVIIQHLSPDFKSLMNELLAKHTSMDIHVIKGDTEIKPNIIYLISAKFNIVIENTMIKQIDRGSTSTLNLPIDIFFHSLGKTAKQKSIGIILSGTGTDGSRGIRTIKEEGGCVFVQDPRTAQFDGMPNTAISTGVVDSVLSPYALAEKVISLGQNAKSGGDAILNMELESDLAIFTRILILVEKETGVNFREYRKSTLLRRLEKRMYLTHISDVNQYYEFMLQNLEETNALYKEFLIGVTRFFRDEGAFAILSENVIPSIFNGKKPQDNIRVWCVGCSTGEEAYSVAIQLKEYINRTKFNRPFKIFATDLDKNAIKRASAGLYSENIIADMPKRILEKYFVKVGNSFRIIKSVRDHLVFTAHDALRDPPFINMDLIVCRNMMIYINPSIQKNLLTSFQFALNYQGFLFLGPSESITPVKKAFRAIDNRWNIFRNISNKKPLPFPKERSIGLSQKYERKLKNNSLPISTTNNFPSTPKYDDFIAREISEQFGPKSLFINSKFEIIYINGDFKDILEFPRAFAQMNLLLMIDENEELLFRNGVRKILSKDGENSSTYKNVQLQRGKKTIDVDIRFSLFTTRNIDEDLVWIEFTPNEPEQVTNAISKEVNEVISFNTYKSEQLKTLELELRQVKTEKQYLVEQLETTNEELQSSNEELMAANEELQSTNEELQSVNEELYTVNTELQSKITELIISNNDITNLLSSTDIGTIFLDLNLRIRKFTPALRDQFDLEESDLGRPIFNFSNSLAENIYDEIELVLKTKEPIEREIADKTGNCFLMRMLPYWANEKTLDGVVISFININEIKQARKEIEGNSQKYETLFAHTQDVITSLNRDGIVTAINAPRSKYFDPNNYIGKYYYQLDGIEDPDILKDAFKKAKSTKSSTNYVTKYFSKNGKKMWFDADVVPLIQDGKIQSFIVVSHDITRHKELQGKLKDKSKVLEKKLSVRNNELEKAVMELKEVNSYLDSFVHGAAHDLRAPIAQMKGMINLLPKVKDDAQVKKILKQFGKGVSHMSNTLNGLIELIEFQKNTGELISTVNLIQVYEEVISQLKSELEETQGVIKTDFQKPCKIDFIPAYIKSIFYNLLSNAIKYRSYGRPLEIFVTIKKELNFYIIQIKDNGIGMDLTKYDHLVFQPFKRLTLERDGIGIGLSIINSAVKKAGGRIEVESKLGKGSTFTAILAPMKKIKKSSQKNTLSNEQIQEHKN